MKKKFMAIMLILVLVLAAGLTACGGGDDGNDGGGGFEYGTDYINSHLTGDYWIVYTITTYQGGESETSTWEQKRTSNGYYLSYGDDEEMLLIKTPTDYDVYYKDYNGEFANASSQMSEELVSAFTSGMLAYMATYNAFGSSLQRDGSQTVAGKDCAKYKFDYTYPALGYKFKYIYCIEKATGVCLKFEMELISAGQKAGYEFVCTKFETSGITLPAYGRWKDNEFTQKLPIPPWKIVEFEIAEDWESREKLTVTIEDETFLFADAKAYIEQVKAKGFTVDAVTIDEETMAVYTYTAKNAAGWEFYFSCDKYATNRVTLTLTKPL